MMTIVAMAAVILAGCGAPSKDVTGKWYDEEGIAGTIEFKEGGKCELVVMGVAIEGDYTFDSKTGKGAITVTMEDEAQSTDFEVKDETLTVEESVYTKTKVEQMDMSDALEGIGEELGEGMEDLASELGDVTDDASEDLQDAIGDALNEAADTITDAAE